MEICSPYLVEFLQLFMGTLVFFFHSLYRLNKQQPRLLFRAFRLDRFYCFSLGGKTASVTYRAMAPNRSIISHSTRRDRCFQRGRRSGQHHSPVFVVLVPPEVGVSGHRRWSSTGGGAPSWRGPLRGWPPVGSRGWWLVGSWWPCRFASLPGVHLKEPPELGMSVNKYETQLWKEGLGVSGGAARREIKYL